MSVCIQWRRLLQSFFILIPAWFSLAVAGDTKPEINAYLNKYASSMEKPAGIVYWSFDHLSFIEDKEISIEEKVISDRYFINPRIRMLTEYSAFLSRKNIYPEVYLLTGIYRKDIIKDFLSSLNLTTFDSYFLNESGKIEDLKPEPHGCWNTVWIEEKGLVAIFREPLLSGEHPVTPVGITAELPLDSVAAGEAFTITLRLRYGREINILLYKNAVRTANHFACIGGQPWSGDSVSDHPAMLGLQQGIIEARKFFGENSPFLVATTLNLPVDQPEIRQYLKENLAVFLNFNSSLEHSFNPEKNHLAQLWSNAFGGIDFAEQGTTSALVDMIGLHNQNNQQDLTVKMRVIPFESVQTVRTKTFLTTFDGKPHGDNCFINEETSAPGHDKGAITCVHDSVASPSSNEPVYAEVSFSSVPSRQFRLPGVYAPRIKDDKGIDQYVCDTDVIRKTIDFAKHRQLPGSTLFVTLYNSDKPKLCGQGRVCGHIIKTTQDPGNVYKSEFFPDHSYLGTLIKSPQGQVTVSTPQIITSEDEITIPLLLCNLKAEELQPLLDAANNEYQHKDRFLGRVEGEHLIYNLFYKD